MRDVQNLQQLMGGGSGGGYGSGGGGYGSYGGQESVPEFSVPPPSMFRAPGGNFAGGGLCKPHHIRAPPPAGLLRKGLGADLKPRHHPHPPPVFDPSGTASALGGSETFFPSIF